MSHLVEVVTLGALWMVLLFYFLSLPVSHFQNIKLTDVTYLVVYCIALDNI